MMITQEREQEAREKLHRQSYSVCCSLKRYPLWGLESTRMAREWACVLECAKDESWPAEMLENLELTNSVLYPGSSFWRAPHDTQAWYLRQHLNWGCLEHYVAGESFRGESGFPDRPLSFPRLLSPILRAGLIHTACEEVGRLMRLSFEGTRAPVGEEPVLADAYDTIKAHFTATRPGGWPGGWSGAQFRYMEQEWGLGNARRVYECVAPYLRELLGEEDFLRKRQELWHFNECMFPVLPMALVDKRADVRMLTSVLYPAPSFGMEFDPERRTTAPRQKIAELGF